MPAEARNPPTRNRPPSAAIRSTEKGEKTSLEIKMSRRQHEQGFRCHRRERRRPRARLGLMSATSSPQEISAPASRAAVWSEIRPAYHGESAPASGQKIKCATSERRVRESTAKKRAIRCARRLRDPRLSAQSSASECMPRSSPATLGPTCVPRTDCAWAACRRPSARDR